MSDLGLGATDVSRGPSQRHPDCVLSSGGTHLARAHDPQGMSTETHADGQSVVCQTSHLGVITRSGIPLCADRV